MTRRDTAVAILEKIKKYSQDTEGWKETKNHSNVCSCVGSVSQKDVAVHYKASADWNGTLFKSEGEINASPETVYAYIEPNPSGPRCKWDKAVKSLETVEQVDSEVVILRTVTHSAFGGLISSRDFIDLVYNTSNDEFLATCAEATEHSQFPVSSGVVRARNYPCAIICRRIPSSPDKCLMTTFVQTDLAGNLPKSLVENALPSNQVDFFTSLKKALKEDGKIVQ